MRSFEEIFRTLGCGTWIVLVGAEGSGRGVLVWDRKQRKDRDMGDSHMYI